MKKKLSIEPRFTSNKRIYITVPESDFKVGDHYTYEYEPKKNRIKIIKSETGNTISHRPNSDVPLIDIRSQKVLQHFKTAEKLQFVVLKNKILVTGVWKAIDQVKNVIQFKKRGQQQVEQLCLSFAELDRVVGDHYSKSIQTLHPFVSPPVMEDLKHVLQVVSLFSGAGFSDYGLIQAIHENLKFRLVKAYDYEKGPCSTYAYNLGNHIEQVDLATVDLTSIPQTEVMVVTPPCFGFTKNNHGKKNQEYLTKQKDFTKLAADAIVANPKCLVFIMENVPDLLSPKNKEYFQYLLTHFKDFELSYGILNAADFGAPQQRKRFFMIGSKIGYIPLPTPTHTEEEYKTVGEAFEGITDDLPNMKPSRPTSPDVLHRISFIPPGGNIQDVPEKFRVQAKFSNAYHRLDATKPAITITNFGKTCMSHPTENRLITVREACRLMGVPDDYIIHGPGEKQQVANGVVPAVIKAVGERILNAFERFFKRSGIICLGH